MSKFEVTRPFPLGSESKVIGDIVESDSGDGLNWKLLEKRGYVRQVRDDNVPLPNVEGSAPAGTFEALFGERGAPRIVVTEGETLVFSNVDGVVFDVLSGRVLDADENVLFDPANGPTVNFVETEDAMLVRSIDEKLDFDILNGRVLDAVTGAQLYPFIDSETAPAASGSGTGAQSPVSEGSQGGDTPAGGSTPAGTGTPIGGAGTPTGDGTTNSTDGADRTGSAPTVARAEIVEGEGGWFRIEAGGAKVGSSTRDRAEAERRVAEYNEKL